MKQYFPLVFFIIFLAILVFANIYLSKRFNFYFNIGNSKMMYAVFPPLTLLMFFGMMPLSNTTSGLGSFVYIISALTMGALLYLLLSVIFVDIIGLFSSFSPKTYGLTALLITFLIVVGGILNAWNIRVSKHDVFIKGLNDEVRVMHLSDIHLGHFRGKNFLQKIVDKTNRENVDAVFITGDLFDGKINLMIEELAPLKQMNAPIYFIEGNHDKYSGIQTIKKMLKKIDVQVLENEVVQMGEIQIVGLNHMAADENSFNMHASAGQATIKGILSKMNIDKNIPSILLHHSPDGVIYANEKGVDLYLAGHTHAGQLFPVKYIAQLIFEYNKGMHDFNGTRMFVSQGVGTFGPPMRVGTKSEIAVITLKPE